MRILRRAVKALAWTLPGAVIAGAIVVIFWIWLFGCGSLGDSELARYELLRARVVAFCESQRPGPALDTKLGPIVDELLEIDSQSPHQPYDPNPHNDPDADDSTTPHAQLGHIQNLLLGPGDPPTGGCSRALGVRVLLHLED